MNISESVYCYGKGDETYLALGAAKGIEVLVKHFYDVIDQDPKFQLLRVLHDKNLTESRAKLKAFLSGWMGGLSVYQQEYGPINIPSAHAHLDIDQIHGGQWLGCMRTKQRIQKS